MAVKKVRLLFAIIVFIYIVSPIVFKYSPFIQRSLLFMNRVNTQYNFNLSQPELLGIKCTRLLRLTNDDNKDKLQQQPSSHGDNNNDSGDNKFELGVWHILPGSSLPSCATTTTTHNGKSNGAGNGDGDVVVVNHTTIQDGLAFADSRPIVLYAHGNGGTRAGDHRSRLYRRLAYELDYHIVTFDYRGYGDSTYELPTTFGLSADATFMYKWLLKQPNVTKDRVIVWGHSLGTAVAVRMVSGLEDHLRPRRLILEAPFDSIANAIANHPFSTPFRVIPYFEYFFVDPIKHSPELNFDSAALIGKIDSTPILILHAEDDVIIPIKLGQNLYKVAREKLGKSRVRFAQIGASLGLGHKYICSHDETMSKVKEFIGD